MRSISRNPFGIAKARETPFSDYNVGLEPMRKPPETAASTRVVHGFRIGS